ncbi:MAG: hypothetical protein AAB432_01015 [Patescibacteria group bacterium]
MGFFSSDKTLYREKLGILLNQISALSPEEKEYVKAIFGKYAADGISKFEAEKAIRELKFNFSDNLDSTEVEKIKIKILSFFT